MSQSSVCCNLCQNPHNGKDELAGRTPTKGSDRRTPVSAVTRAFTPAVAPVIALLVVSGPADSSVVRYLEDDLQQIVRTIFEAKLLPPPSPPPVLAPVVAATPHNKGPRERLLKARFLDIEWDKTHLECYNFF